MLRILASMGLTIAEFTHEYGTRAGAMQNDLNTVLDSVVPQGEARKAARRLLSHLSDVEGFTEYFATTLRQNVVRTIQPIELYAFSLEFCEQMRPLFGDRISTVQIPEPKQPQVFTTAMHPSEWSSILMNFLTNSRKAIDLRKVQEGKIRIETGFRDDETILLSFSDNGIGIPHEIQEQIFEPFFTTTAAAATGRADQDRLVGTGLGLKIVHDIVTGIGGTIEVSEPLEGYSTTICVYVPAATAEELEKIYAD